MKNTTLLSLLFLCICATVSYAQNVGIGQPSPSHTLHITPLSSTDDPLRIDGLKAFGTADTSIMVINNATGVVKYINPVDLIRLLGVDFVAGPGITISGNTITNSSPNIPVSIAGTGGTTVSGTYPNFTVNTTDFTAGAGISISGGTITNTAQNQAVTITGTGATSVSGTYPNFTVNSTDNVNDADAVIGNEYNTGATLTGTTLNIMDGGGAQTVDLSSLQDGVNDADAVIGNEYNTGATLTGTTLNIMDGGGAQTVDLSSLQDGVNDADAVIGNEYNTGATLTGTMLSVTDGGGSQIVDLSNLTGTTGVTAGTGLTGGGTGTNPTINASADNGINIDAAADKIQLGGPLTETTTITHGAFSLNYDLNDVGNFHIRDAGVRKFAVLNNGHSYFGGNVYIRDGSTVGTITSAFLDDGNDGRLIIYEDGLSTINLDANTGVIFNEQGKERDFRVESVLNDYMLFVNATTNRVGVGTLNPTHELHVLGDTRVSSLQGVGTRMVTSNANGVLGTQAIGVAGVTAGAGLTGGGTTGTPTVSADANNGLNVDAAADKIQLGGALTEATTLTYGTFSLVNDLTSTGDFHIRDAGVNKFSVLDNGNTYTGGDVYFRDGVTNGPNLAVLLDDGDDGRFQIYEDGVPSIILDANGTSIFNSQGLNRDFRVEGDTNPNLLVADASTDRVGVGTAGPIRTLDVRGEIAMDSDKDGDFAFITQGLDGGGIGLVGQLTRIDNPDLYVSHNPGYVGINNTNPTARLHVIEPPNGALTTMAMNVTKNFDGQSNESAAFIGGIDAGKTETGIYVLQKDNFSFSSANTSLLNIVENGNSKMLVTGLGNVGIGTTAPAQKLHVVGNARISALAGAGTRMVTANANGDLATQAIPVGDVTGVTAGAGLTGGGTSGTPTVSAAANNGLNVDAAADRIQLGGLLTEATTITQGAFAANWNLNGTGDFHIKDNGTNVLSVLDNGNSYFGRDVYFRDANTGGTIIGAFLDDGDDGRFQIYENGTPSIVLDANGTSVFNEQSLDRNLRVESDANLYMLFVDGGTNRVGIGTGAPTQALHVNGRVKSNGINETSDRRYKKDIAGLEDALEKVMLLRGVNYKWKINEFPNMGFENGLQLGVIAQEIESVFPEVVHTDEQGYKSVEYSHLVPVLIESIKELNQNYTQDITSLQEENEMLKAKMDDMNSSLESIQAFLKMNGETVEHSKK